MGNAIMFLVFFISIVVLLFDGAKLREQNKQLFKQNEKILSLLNEIRNHNSKSNN